MSFSIDEDISNNTVLCGTNGISAPDSDDQNQHQQTSIFDLISSGDLAFLAQNKSRYQKTTKSSRALDSGSLVLKFPGAPGGNGGVGDFCNTIDDFIPYLTRLYVNRTSRNDYEMRTVLYKVLHSYNEVTQCVSYYNNVNWDQVAEAVHNERQIRRKNLSLLDNVGSLGSGTTIPNFRAGSYVETLENNNQLTSAFESEEQDNSHSQTRARILLSELCSLIDYGLYHYQKQQSAARQRAAEHNSTTVTSPNTTASGGTTGGGGGFGNRKKLALTKQPQQQQKSVKKHAAAPAAAPSSSSAPKSSTLLMPISPNPHAAASATPTQQQKTKRDTATPNNNNNKQPKPTFASQILSNEIYLRNVELLLPICFNKCACNHRFQLFTLEELLIGLMYAEFSESLIVSLVANNPTIFEKAVECIIGMATILEDQIDEIRSILLRLCQLSIYCARFIRDCCLNRNILPTVVFVTTVQHIRDPIELLSSILNTGERNALVWRYIQAACKEMGLVTSADAMDLDDSASDITATTTSVANYDTNIMALLKDIVAQLQSQQELMMQSTTPSSGHQSVVRLCTILRVCCGLAGLSGVSVCTERSHFDLISSLCLSSNSERLAKLGLCFLLISVGLEEHLCKETIRNVVGGLCRANKCKDTLLLLATYFHTRSWKSFANFIRSTTHLNIRIDSKILKQIAALFTEELITIEVLAKEILKISPRRVASSEDWFVLQCVYHLLKSRLFRQHGIDASEWVYNQICCFSDQTRYPLNPYIMRIVSELVENSLPNTAYQFCMKLFPKDKVLDVLEGRRKQLSETFTPRLLMLYYVLSVNTHRSVEGYGSEIIEQCGIIQVVKFLQRHKQNLLQLYAPLLTLIVGEYQHLFHLNTLLLTDESAVSAQAPSSLSAAMATGFTTTMQNLVEMHSDFARFLFLYHNNRDSIVDILKNPLKNQIKTKIVLDNLCKMDSNQLDQDFQELLVEQSLPHLLDRSAEKYLLKSFEALWLILSTANPMQLTLRTVNVFLNSNITRTSSIANGNGSANNNGPRVRKAATELTLVKYNHDDIARNCLLLFGSHPRVFEMPPLFAIFLQILGSYMTAFHKLVATTAPQQQPASGGVHANTFVLTQDSTVVQMLLELCLDREDDDEEAIDELPIIRQMVCSFIHQIFIENPILAKLVHFQTYDSSLLPITVTGIDSIHICLDFLIELIEQPQVEKQVFGVQLASYICEKYPLPRSLPVARTALNRIHQFSSNASLRDAAIATAESLARIGCSFPATCAQDSVLIMDQMKTTFKSDPHVQECIRSAFEKVIDFVVLKKQAPTL